jgi:hypothetical protein
MNVPPKISRANYWFALAVLGMAGTGAMAVLFFFNPSQYHFYPTCAFHRLTGLNCPGCGMTRALYALLHGDIRTAGRDNALLMAALAGLALRGVWLARARRRGHTDDGWVPASWVWPLLFIALIFTVLRNLPAFSFLSPA